MGMLLTCTCGARWLTKQHREKVCNCHKNLCPLYTTSLMHYDQRTNIYGLLIPR